MSGRDVGRRLRVVLAVLCLPVLLEVGLRLGGFSHEPGDAPLVLFHPVHDTQLDDSSALHVFDPATLWAPRPGAALPWAPDERVSPSGYRGGDPDPDAQLRIVALGDSSTFGMFLPDGGWPEWLERRLGARRTESVQVVNAGVIASTLAQGLARYEALRPWSPAFVVAAFGVTNEQWPAWNGLPDTEKMAAVRAGEWRSEIRGGLRVLQLVSWMLGEPSRAEVLQAQHDGQLTYLADPDYVPRVSPAEFEAGLGVLLERVRADGARLILVSMPRRAVVEELNWPVHAYDEVLTAFARREGVRLVDARADFRAGLAAGLSEDELFCDRFHPSDVGQVRIAGLVLEALD